MPYPRPRLNAESHGSETASKKRPGKYCMRLGVAHVRCWYSAVEARCKTHQPGSSLFHSVG